jgi:hypothetical protein
LKRGSFVRLCGVCSGQFECYGKTIFLDHSGEKIDLLLIDGDHTRRGCVRDFNALHGHIRKGDTLYFMILTRKSADGRVLYPPINSYLHYIETFEKRSILFKAKEGENFNHRNTLSILRIKI